MLTSGHVRHTAALIAAIALLAAPACNRPKELSGASAPTTTKAEEKKPTINEGSGSLLLTGKLEVTGAIEGSDEIEEDAKTGGFDFRTTCSELAEDGMGDDEPYFQIPGADAEIDGKHTRVYLFLSPYRGPGAFDKDDFPPFGLNENNKFTGVIIDFLGEDPRQYEPVEAATITARIEEDASGELEFVDLQEEKDGQKISGTIKWDCLDPDPAEASPAGTPSPEGTSRSRETTPSPSPSRS